MPKFSLFRLVQALPSSPPPLVLFRVCRPPLFFSLALSGLPALGQVCRVGVLSVPLLLRSLFASWLLLVPWFHPQVLRSLDILWFIDNEAAANSLIRGDSRESDVHSIVQFSYLLYHHLQCRVWFGWIGSHSNPSDGLSRLGLLDQWTIDPRMYTNFLFQTTFSLLRFYPLSLNILTDLTVGEF